MALVAAVLLAACGGTGQAPPPTATGYPIRPPVVGSPRTGTTATGTEIAVVATARVEVSRGNAEEALRLLDASLAAEGESVEMLTARAEARLELGDVAAAIADLTAAIGLGDDVGGADLFRRRAAAWERLGRLDEAAADWSEAINREPGEAAGYLGRARVLTDGAVGDTAAYQAALNDTGRALAADPGSVAARLTRARIYLERLRFRGDPADGERALIELDAVPAAGGGVAAALLRAEALAASGDPAGAEAMLSAPTVRTTDAPPVADGQRAETEARVALAARRWADAAEAAAEAAGELPDSSLPLRLGAEAALGQEEPAAALDVTTSLVERRPEDGVGWYLRGLALINLGRTEEGVAALRRAAALMPESPVYRARIEQRLRALGVAATPATPTVRR